VTAKRSPSPHTSVQAMLAPLSVALHKPRQAAQQYVKRHQQSRSGAGVEGSASSCKEGGRGVHTFFEEDLGVRTFAASWERTV